MDLRPISFKKEAFLDKNLPNTYFQKRLEAFLKTSPFKQPQNPLSNTVYSKENIEKLKQSLIPIVILQSLLKLSVFQALKHHIPFSNKQSRSKYLNELREIERKISEITKNQHFEIVEKSMEKSLVGRRKRKLMEIVLKINKTNDFYSLKTRQFFHRWRLISFENGLRKINTYHSEIIIKQTKDQLNNLNLVLGRKAVEIGFNSILAYSRSQKPGLSHRKFAQNKEAKEKALLILDSALSARYSLLKLSAFDSLKSILVLPDANYFDQRIKKELKKKKFSMFWLILALKVKGLLQDSFTFLRRGTLRDEVPTHDFDKTKKLASKILFQILSSKFSQLTHSFFPKLKDFAVINRSKPLILSSILKKTQNRLLFSSLKEWSLITIKSKDPLISTKPKLIIQAISSSQNKTSSDFIHINKNIIINQALVNKELELEQKKKADKLLRINQNLGLIEIETLIERKRRQYSRHFFNNFLVLGTFDPKRYQEYEHYLKILQEEKEILHNELEEIENYNKKFAQHLDQKMYSIWGAGSSGSGAGIAPSNEDKSFPEVLMMEPNSIFNEENEEAIISINYLEFLEKQNVDLREEVTRNEQRIKHEEEKYENELNILKENIRALQTKNTAAAFKPNTKKGKLPEKKLSMIKSINSFYAKKSYTHDQDESDY